jgi:hypothetical protein
VKNLCHHSLGTVADRYDLEVWADDPNVHTDPREVTLYVSESGGETFYVNLTPAEARALAALLVVSADRQERATNPQLITTLERSR